MRARLSKTIDTEMALALGCLVRRKALSYMYNDRTEVRRAGPAVMANTKSKLFNEPEMAKIGCGDYSR